MEYGSDFYFSTPNKISYFLTSTRGKNSLIQMIIEGLHNVKPHVLSCYVKDLPAHSRSRRFSLACILLNFSLPFSRRGSCTTYAFGSSLRVMPSCMDVYNIDHNGNKKMVNDIEEPENTRTFPEESGINVNWFAVQPEPSSSSLSLISLLPGVGSFVERDFLNFSSLASVWLEQNHECLL